MTTVLNDREGCVVFFERMDAQTAQPAEIVIVDGGSTDGTWEFLLERQAERGPAVRLLQEKGCNVARGRNLAIDLARFDLIVSTDVGCEWDREWFAELARPLVDDPDCEAVMGSWAVRTGDLATVWAKVEFALLDAPKMRAEKDSLASSRAIAYRKTLWERIGGYPEDLTLAADDVVFGILLHAKTKSVAAAATPRCFWERLTTLRRFAKESRRNGLGVGEAGIWLNYGVLVGGRLAAEMTLPVFGLLLAAVEWLVWRRVPVAGTVCLGIGLLLIAARIARLRPAMRRFAASGGSGAFWRVTVFEYAVKYAGVMGYWNGYLTGGRRCAETRSRLRAAGVPKW